MHVQLCVWLFVCSSGVSSISLDPLHSVVWGPAIDLPHLDLPVRYFFVQLVDQNGQNVTNGSVQSLLRVNWQSENCRFRREIIDRFDGSLIIRFRLFDACAWIRISLSTVDGQSIAQSPYFIQKESGEWLYAETCNCGRKPSLDEWILRSECNTQSMARIDRDISLWKKKSVQFPHALNVSQHSWAHPDRRYSTALCHYRFLHNRIYRKCFGEYVGFNMFSDQIFTSMARKFSLPNTEFLMNLGDWPLETELNRLPYPVPILSCSDTTTDLVLPTYELTEATVHSMNRITLDVHTALGDIHFNWTEKLDKAVFRGRDSRQERLDLVLMARNRPHDLHAGITRFFFFDDTKHLYEPTVQHQPFGQFFKYRYVLSVDGTVAAYRLPFLLAGDSLVLKQDSPYYEHFYMNMQPYVHYVPVKRDLTDLFDQIQWARENPHQVNRIITNTKQFVQDHLQAQHVYCYHAFLLKRYTELLTWVPNDIEDVEDMEEVPLDAEDNYGKCTCPPNSHINQKSRKQEL